MNQTPPVMEPTTPEQFAKWEELTRAMLRRNGIDNRAGFQDLLGYPHLADQMDIIIRRAKKAGGITPATPTTVTLTKSQLAAQAIMGTNFFGTQEAAKHFRARWTQRQLDDLATVPFSPEVLEACKCTHILVAGYPMTLLQVRTKANQAKRGKLFYSPTGGWYETEAFARKTKVEVRWYLIRKKPVDNSTNKSWDDQQLLLNDEATPMACVMVYAIIGHFLSRGERLFEKIYVRVSDIDSLGRRVSVGLFDPSGFVVGRGSGSDRLSDLGLSASRNF